MMVNLPLMGGGGGLRLLIVILAYYFIKYEQFMLPVGWNLSTLSSSTVPERRAICHTERSRRSGKIYKGRRNTVFRPEHEILSNRHLYYKHVDSACMYSQWQQRQHLVQEVEEIPFSQTWIWYPAVRQFILKTRQWQWRQRRSLIHETRQWSTLRKILDGLFVWVQYEIKV
jgi:hypothetical protein